METVAGDPYQLLGVSQTADTAEIKRAYRRLAKELHPDRNADRPETGERFKAVSGAWDLLSDPEKRAAYDRGEIDGDGNPLVPRGFEGFGPGFARGPGEGPQQFRTDDLFSELFGRGRGFRQSPVRGSDVAYTLAVPFADAATARPQRITLMSGRTIDLKLPPGVEDGQQLRLQGQGEAGPGGAGDALIALAVQPDPRFERSNDDIRGEALVPLELAVLGGPMRVPTPEGEVELKIAPRTNSGRSLRLKGRGWTRKDGTRGDLLVRVLVDVPTDPELERYLQHRRSGETPA